MSILKVISSGSIGNAYILECKSEILLLELGVSWDKIKRALNFNLSKVVGCIVSHSHGDHAKSVKDAIKAEIPVYSTEEIQSLHPKVKVPKMGQKTLIGGFSIQPLLVPHSVECYAYIITHEEFGKLVFCTDATSFKYKVKNVNHWLIEANYSEQILIDKMCDNSMGRSLYQHHMEIEDTIKALKVNFCSDTQSILLVHLSESNSNESAFIQRVEDELGFPMVEAAKACQVIELYKEEF